MSEVQFTLLDEGGAEGITADFADRDEAILSWLFRSGYPVTKQIELYVQGVPKVLKTVADLQASEFWEGIEFVRITEKPLELSEPVFGDHQFVVGHENNSGEQGGYTPETSSAMSGVAATGAMLARAVPHGAGVGLADEANEAIKSGVTAGLIKAGLPSELVQNEVVEKISLILAPLVIHYIATAHAGILPGFINPQFLAAGAEMAVEAKARDNIQPILAAIGPMLKDVASVGEKHASVTVLRGGASGDVENAEAVGG
jgi:hypothetical protein